MKKGFTLIEMLVASLLLGMLVSILTMVFNASSIAWRTGRASVVSLDKMRRQVALCQRVADDMVYLRDKNGGDSLAVVRTPWEFNDSSGSDDLRKRGIRSISASFGFTASDVKWMNGSGAPWKEVRVNRESGNGSQKTYAVGVMSYGPDGQTGGEYSADDITSWPEDLK